MKAHRQLTLLCVFLLVLVPGKKNSLYAAEPVFEKIHWAYSYWFGTGWYQIEDNRSVFVLKIMFPGKKVYGYLLNSLYFAGYTPDRGRSDHLAVAQLGFELRQPIDNANLAGQAIDLHWSFIYSFLGNELHFNLPEGNFDVVQDQYEAGIALSPRHGPFEFWNFKIHRLGLGYRFSTNGQFRALTLSMNSWFRK